MSIIWNSGSAAERFRHNRKLILENRKRKRASSPKLQAPSPRRATIKKDNKT